jgi:hypothetical protein
MGVTINFEGQLKDEAAYRALIEVAAAMAKAEGWATELIDAKEVRLLRVRGEEETDYVGPVKGIVLYVHEDCDPLRLEFDRELFVQEFVKTQFARVEVHVKVIRLLEALTPYFRELHLDDEGEWWERRDAAVLAEHFDRVQHVIDEELQKNPSIRVKVKTPSGRIMDILS